MSRLGQVALLCLCLCLSVHTSRIFAADLAIRAGRAKQLTVRVERGGGAPRLLVNGRAVRARMFWGAPGSGLLALTRGEQLVEFEFTPSQSEPSSATMHFRFGRVPGDIYLDDLRVAELETGRDVIPLTTFEAGEGEFAREWKIWPFDDQNTVGTVRIEQGMGRAGSKGLHVRLKAPANGTWPDFHIYHDANLILVAGYRYRVSFWARAEPARDFLVAFYRPGTNYVHLGGPPGHFESQIRLAAGAGVDFVSFELPMPWPKRGERADWHSVDAICRNVLRINPRALLLPRIGLYAPDWWLREHPDEAMLWENGKHQGIASAASLPYREDAARTSQRWCATWKRNSEITSRVIIPQGRTRASGSIWILGSGR
jgi:hypothetical protein